MIVESQESALRYRIGSIKIEMRPVPATIEDSFVALIGEE